MLLIQNAYYEANTAFVYIGMYMANVTVGAYHANVITITRFTDVIGALALSAPNTLLAPSVSCNDPFVQVLRTGLTTIIGVLTALGVVIAVIGIIVGGLMRATAWGSDQRIAVSNKAISSSIVGLIIVLLAVALGTAIPNWFGLQSSSCPLAPSSQPAPVATHAPSTTASP
jgi:hypothetical protein